jgi:putative aminopeptidase FrvX
MELLKKLCTLQAPSGDEGVVKDFLLDYVKAHSTKWAVQPQVIEGEQFQDCMIWAFGVPRTAVFVHMDSIGFTVRYHNQLIPIGAPHVEEGDWLVGQDSKGPIAAQVHVSEEEELRLNCTREVDRGTTLTFKPDFIEDEESVQCCYMDNRLGLYAALKLAETLKDGLIVFSAWEEHSGGSVPYLAKYIYEQYQVSKALVCDITWVTEGVQHGKGVAISMRDRLIPRKTWLNSLIQLAQQSGIPFQLEVEGSGSSDARELQAAPYPFDWCFIGAPESNVHSPREKVHKKDIESMIALYSFLLKNL